MGRTRTSEAALYRNGTAGVASAEQLHGKEMSYNNYVDTEAAVRAAHDHGDQPTVAIVKHANPCGHRRRRDDRGGLRARACDGSRVGVRRGSSRPTGR